MKHLFFALFFMSFLSLAKAQDTNITGTWYIIEFTMTNEENVNKMTEDQLAEKQFVWDLNLLEDGSMTQTSNMRIGETETQEGTWESDNGVLKLNLKFNDRDIVIEYGYDLTRGVLTLKRGNPMGTMSVETKYKRKS